MPYIEFTDSQKQRAAAVDLEAFLLSRGERLLHEGRDKRLASDHSVTICGNEWYDHAVKEGGGPATFVQKFYGLSYPEAMTCLLNGERGEIRATPPPPSPWCGRCCSALGLPCCCPCGSAWTGCCTPCRPPICSRL